MSELQLSLDGQEVEHPVRVGRPLTPRQRELLRWIRDRAEVETWEVGRAWHTIHPESCLHSEPLHGKGCCRWSSSHATDALRRLGNRGLVEKIERGRYRATAADEGEWIHPLAVPLEVREQIIASYRRGLSQRAIAEQVFYSETTVARVLHDAGEPIRHRVNRHRRLDPDDVLATMELYGRGYSSREIGELLGISESTARYRIRIYGEPRHGSEAHMVPIRRRATTSS